MYFRNDVSNYSKYQINRKLSIFRAAGCVQMPSRWIHCFGFIPKSTTTDVSEAIITIGAEISDSGIHFVDVRWNLQSLKRSFYDALIYLGALRSLNHTAKEDFYVEIVHMVDIFCYVLELA